MEEKALPHKMNKELPTVVSILPFVDDKVIMQLRDQKKEIVFPGHWGFFSGEINRDETALEAAFRETKEELSLQPRQFCLLGTDSVPERNFSYIFTFKLTEPLSAIELREGLDFGLVSFWDIEKKVLFSKKLNKFFPIVPLPFIAKTFRKCLDHEIDLETLSADYSKKF